MDRQSFEEFQPWQAVDTISAVPILNVVVTYHNVLCPPLLLTISEPPHTNGKPCQIAGQPALTSSYWLPLIASARVHIYGVVSCLHAWRLCPSHFLRMYLRLCVGGRYSMRILVSGARAGNLGRTLDGNARLSWACPRVAMPLLFMPWPETLKVIFMVGPAQTRRISIISSTCLDEELTQRIQNPGHCVLMVANLASIAAGSIGKDVTLSPSSEVWSIPVLLQSSVIYTTYRGWSLPLV